MKDAAMTGLLPGGPVFGPGATKAAEAAAAAAAAR
jgi:hypothetical protein